MEPTVQRPIPDALLFWKSMQIAMPCASGGKYPGGKIAVAAVADDEHDGSVLHLL